MKKYLKDNWIVVAAVTVAIIAYISSLFIIKADMRRRTAVLMADSMLTSVSAFDDRDITEESLVEYLEDSLAHFYMGDDLVPVVLFYRAGGLGETTSVYFSTLEECSVERYNISKKDSTASSGIDGYFKIKGITDCYRKLMVVDGTGYYDGVTIDDEDYYIIYAYAPKIHSLVMGFIRRSTVNSMCSPVDLVFLILFVIIAAGVAVWIFSGKRKIKEAQDERDEIKHTMAEKDRRMDILSFLMNEYTFEYDIKHDTLSFAEKYQTIFQRGKYFVRFLENLKTRYNIYHLDQQNIRKSFDEIMEGKEEGNCLFRLQMPSGNYEWFNALFKVLLDDKQKPYYIVGKIMNVHQSQTEKEMLLSKSTRDPLTNLLNRAEIENRTTSYISEMVKDDLAAVVIMDLDHFKQVNDTFGHSKGDELLIEAAGIIQNNFRTNDIVGRLGGDEFYIFMKDILNSADALSKCEQLRRKLDKDVTYGDTSVKISTSIGLAFVKAGDEFLEIYMKADSALYRAKEGGRNRICVNEDPALPDHSQTI